MRFTPPSSLGGSVLIEIDQIEAIALYKIVLAADDPRGMWPDDEDVLALSAALQVQLSAVVGP